MPISITISRQNNQKKKMPEKRVNLVFKMLDQHVHIFSKLNMNS